MSFWDVSLAVTGHITVQAAVSFQTHKGDLMPFETTVKVKNARNGLRIDVMARADSLTDAKDAAVYFVGKALDVLSFRVGMPLYLNPAAYEFNELNENARLIVTEAELRDAFQLSRHWGSSRPAFLRALSWLRKGYNSDDQIDRFLAFWSAIEGVSAKCSRKNEKTKKGAINQICDCFDQVWNDVAHWQVIPNEAAWINKFHELRNGIAHGFRSVDVEMVREVGAVSSRLEQLTLRFLRAWEHEGIPDERNLDAPVAV
jgi:hypothetical protein